MKPSLKTVPTVLLETLFFLILAWTVVPPSASAQTIQVTSANPPSTPQGTVNLNVTVNGKGFKKGALAKFYVSSTTSPGGITVNSTAFVNSGQLIANINVAQNATISKFDILVANADGRTGKGTELFAVTVPDPAIAFVSGYGTLMVMDADGSNQLIVFQAPRGFIIASPDWSPDGKQLVFSSNVQGNGVYVVNVDGTGFRKVIATGTFGGPLYPGWSPVPLPDGQFKIVFSDTLPGRHDPDLFLVNLDGTGLQDLTNSVGPGEYWPSWDRYASRIAISYAPDGYSTYNLVVFSLGFVNGAVTITGSTNLTASGPLSNAMFYDTSWAKTEDKITVDARQVSNVNERDLWIVDLLNPNSPVMVLAYTGNSSWSPDGSKIAFQGTTPQGRTNIFVMNADGSGVTNIGNSNNQDQLWPAWRRKP